METVLAFLQHEGFVPLAGLVLGFVVPYIFAAVSRRLNREIPSKWKAVVALGISGVVASAPMVLAWLAKGNVSPDEFYQSVPVTFSASVVFYERFLKPRLQS